MRAISKYIDAALLKPTSTPAQVKKLCKEAKKHGFFGVDVLPYYLPLAAKELKGSKVKLIAVVGYPLGLHPVKEKVWETQQAIKQGADEIDMVINLGLFKAGKYEEVVKDINAVVKAAKKRKVKVIIETGYLNDKEIMKAARLVKKAKAHFVKTCSGYGPRGAKLKDVLLIKRAVGRFGIKAAGGIRTAKQVNSFLKAGATRIGTSHGVEIVHSLHKA